MNDSRAAGQPGMHISASVRPLDRGGHIGIRAGRLLVGGHSSPHRTPRLRVPEVAHFVGTVGPEFTTVGPGSDAMNLPATGSTFPARPFRELAGQRHGN